MGRHGPPVHYGPVGAYGATLHGLAPCAHVQYQLTVHQEATMTILLALT